MKETERKEFAMVIGSLAAAFDKEIDSALMRGMWMGLSDLTIDQIRFAATRVLKELQFFPKPAEIRKLAGEQGGKQQAVLAWEIVIKQIASKGSYGVPEYDEATRRVVKSFGGWKHLCSLNADELNTWTRKRFEEDYQTYVEAEQRNNLLTMPMKKELSDGYKS